MSTITESTRPEPHDRREPEELRRSVERHYAEAARRAADPSAGCGCGCGTIDEDAFGRAHYGGEAEAVPEAALRASLGCANPVALADLEPGERVLDLGSGAGLDLILAARRVGPAGKVYGLDMTDEMLELARRNLAEAGVGNAELLRGTIEAVPLPAGSIDVVVSNCVVNLSEDKDAVLAEAYRVLAPGGRFAVADVVALRAVPEVLRRRTDLWAECLGGALESADYHRRLAAAGFEGIDIETVATYGPEVLGEAAEDILRQLGLTPPDVTGLFASAFVRARKPGAPPRAAVTQG